MTSAPAQLSRDDHGVQHIRADDVQGACWGMGYAHAQDRGMQMRFMRVLGQGRLCECLDDSDASFAIDVFFRRMNWAGGLQQQMDLLDDDARALLASYCDGVNAGMAQHRPWELRLLGVPEEPWTTENVILISRMIGYLTLAQSQAEVEHLFVELVQGGVEQQLLHALFKDCFANEQLGDDDGCFAHVSRDILQQVQLDADERLVPPSLKFMAAPRAMASNNWVVAPSRSKSGHALLSNDPHLEVNRLPNVWVEQVIELPDDTWCTANMPGIPAPLVGRNKHLAWGATYTFMDAVDSWVEHIRDGKYKRVVDDDEQWHAFDERVEVIQRKKRGPQQVVFFDNVHGTLHVDKPVNGYALTTKWAPSESGAQSLNAIVDLWKATTVDDGRAALGCIETAWNWVLADDQGDIGYQMSGRCPRRKEGWTGFDPAPGWDPSYDWQGFLDVDELPRVKNPDSGVIVTANQDLNHLGGIRVINMPMGDYRARRIEQVLLDDKHDVDSFAALHMDTFSLQAEEMVQRLRPLLGDDEASDVMRAWTLRYDPDSKGASLFECFYRALLREVFGTAVGHDVVQHLLDATGIFIDFYANFDRLLTTSSAWLGERSLDDVYAAAWSVAQQQFAAGGVDVWSSTNQVLLKHILFDGKLPKFLGFDKGPIPLPGGRATPHQGQVYKSGGRDTSFAPSLRIVADLGDDVLHTALAGGPSDRRFSKHYCSGLQMWREGKLKTLQRLP